MAADDGMKLRLSARVAVCVGFDQCDDYLGRLRLFHDLSDMVWMTEHGGEFEFRSVWF